jgi:alpha-beta hydrolase superfamily lysophospholipase
VICRRPNAAVAIVAAFLLGLSSQSSLLSASSRAVSFHTSDGVLIAAAMFESPRRPAPAVILLHMLTRSRDDWQSLASRLADAGIHALAIDFRGHGASAAGPPGPDGEPDLTRLVRDVQAARAFLATRSDLVRPNAIGIAGASLGANVALLEAAADPAIRSLALLSPGLEYKTLRVDAAMRKYGARPALLIAATNDPYAVRSVRQLVAIGGGPRETRTLENAGHGTTMLGRDPDLSGTLVDWFERTLL